MEENAIGQERQIRLYLMKLGFRHTGMAFRYLQFLLPRVMGGERPGPALWDEAARAFGKQPFNICASLRYGIQQAYRCDPVHFSTVLDDILFRPPQIREFLLRSARWLREHEFVPCSETEVKIVERVDQQQVKL